MPFAEAVQLYTKAQVNYQREKAWDLWKGLYPDMVKGFIKFIPFSEFWQRMHRPVKKISAEDALAIAQRIVAADKGVIPDGNIQVSR